MMFYLYTIVVPILILAFNYFFSRIKPEKFIEYVDLLIKTVPHILGYAFFLYFLEREKHINTSWTFYSVLIILIPITVILLIIRLYYFVKSRNK